MESAIAPVVERAAGRAVEPFEQLEDGQTLVFGEDTVLFGTDEVEF